MGESSARARLQARLRDLEEERSGSHPAPSHLLTPGPDHVLPPPPSQSSFSLTTLSLPHNPPHALLQPPCNLASPSSLTHRLGMEEHPYSSRLKKIRELLEQDAVTREEVVSELGG